MAPQAVLKVRDPSFETSLLKVVDPPHNDKGEIRCQLKQRLHGDCEFEIVPAVSANRDDPMRWAGGGVNEWFANAELDLRMLGGPSTLGRRSDRSRHENGAGKRHKHKSKKCQWPNVSVCFGPSSLSGLLHPLRFALSNEQCALVC